MNLSDFTFIMTEECNFNCSYCYQTKGKKYIKDSVIERAIDFFAPFFADKCYISFYGGEPLLAFTQIEKIVDCIQARDLKNDFQYSLTSNGSLITDDILDFFNHRKFSLQLSFDGLAQDISRKKDSFTRTADTMKKILAYPGIDLEINSVFTPGTVKYLSESVRFIIESGAQAVQLSFSTLTEWSREAMDCLEAELKSTAKFLVPIYRETGTIPVSDFREVSQGGIFACFAGRTRMALSPRGKVWGCYLFWDHFKEREGTKDYGKYCFGDLTSFISSYKKNYPAVLANYEKLRMDHFCTLDTFCMFCSDLDRCRVCPVNAVLSGAVMGGVPASICRIEKMIRQERELFRQELEG